MVFFLFEMLRIDYSCTVKYSVVRLLLTLLDNLYVARFVASLFTLFVLYISGWIFSVQSKQEQKKDKTKKFGSKHNKHICFDAAAMWFWFNYWKNQSQNTCTRWRKTCDFIHVLIHSFGSSSFFHLLFGGFLEAFLFEHTQISVGINVWFSLHTYNQWVGSAGRFIFSWPITLLFNHICSFTSSLSRCFTISIICFFFISLNVVKTDLSALFRFRINVMFESPLNCLFSVVARHKNCLLCQGFECRTATINGDKIYIPYHN